MELYHKITHAVTKLTCIAVSIAVFLVAPTTVVASEFEDSSVNQLSIKIIENFLGDNETFCSKLVFKNQYLVTDDSCEEINDPAAKNISQFTNDPHIKSMLKLDEENAEWRWVTKKSKQQMQYLDYKINYYQELRNSLEFSDDDFGEDSKFTQKSGSACNTNDDVTPEFVKESTGQLFDSLKLANQLIHQKKSVSRSFKNECIGIKGMNIDNLDTPRCKDLEKLITQVQNSLNGLYTAHPVLTSESVQQLTNEMSPEELSKLKLTDLKDHLSNGAQQIQTLLSEKYQSFQDLLNVQQNDKKAINKYLSSPKLLAELAPESWSDINYGDLQSTDQVQEKKAICRLYQRQDKLEVAESISGDLINMALVAGPIASVKLIQSLTSTRLFTSLAPKANLLGGTIDATTFVGATAASALYQSKEYDAIQKECNENLKSYAINPTCSKGAIQQNCNALVAKKMAVATAFIAMEFVGIKSGAATAKLSRESLLVAQARQSYKTLQNNMSTSLTQLKLNRSKNIEAFKRKYAGQRVAVSEDLNKEYIQQSKNLHQPSKTQVYEHEFTRLKKCNDLHLKDKNLCTALDNYFHEAFVENLNLSNQSNVKMYGDYKSKGFSTSTDDVSSEAFDKALKKTLEDLSNKIDLEMPEIRELLNARGEGVEASLNHLFSAGVAKGFMAHDKATIAARIGRASSASDSASVHYFESSLIQNRLKSRREVILNSSASFDTLASTGNNLHLDEVLIDGKLVNVPSTKTFEILRKVNTPRIRTDKRPKGNASNKDVVDKAQQEVLYDDVYIDEVRQQIKQATGQDLGKSDAIKLTSFYHSLESLSLGPRFSARTPINYEDGAKAFISMDIKGMGARNLHELAKLYVRAGPELNSTSLVHLSRQAELNVTELLDEELKLLTTEVSQLPTHTLTRLTNQNVKNLNEEQRIKLAGQIIQRSGDDIVLSSQRPLDQTDLRVIGQQTSRGRLKGQYRATYVAGKKNSDAKYIGQRIEKNEEVEKAIQKRMLKNLPAGKSPVLDVMVVRRSSTISRPAEAMDFILPEKLKPEEIRALILAIKDSVPVHRRGAIVFPDGTRSPISLQ